MEMIATAVAMQIVPTTHRRATVRAVASSGAAASPGGVTGAADASASVAGEAVPPPDVRQELENEIDRAADDVVRAVIVQRVEAAELGFVQFTDEDVKREQVKSVMVQTLKQKATYRGQRVFTGEDGIVHAEVGEGESRIILPAKYWALAFKEAHDSLWAGHLRGPQTYEQLRRLYWWPHMREAVHDWVSACQDCGSRKARPRMVVPPLRSVKTGDVCDRWAIDVAGPLPVTMHGNRYVIAAVVYTTRYAVAEAVSEHTAKAIAQFLMNKVVLVYGPMREIMMDGAMEFGSKATAELLELMQAKQSTPVPYRPNLLGLVERFHRTWKDMISLYVDEEQTDWDDFLPSALYAYNSSQHATHGFQPIELMMGRKLRTPAELLRRNRLVYPHSTLEAYHEVLLQDLRTARELAAIALQKEQSRQALYYNRRNARHRSDFRLQQLVWIYRPAKGPGITKFGHRWRGPAQIVEDAGYDNYLVRMLESGRELVTHCSFLLPYSYPTNLLDQMAQDIALDLREEAIAAADIDPEDEESVPQEMPSTASEVSGVAQPASATVEADEQRPADRGLQVQPGVEAAPASAPRRAGQKRKQAAKPAVQQGLLDEADDTTDATTRTSRRKKARPARTASNSTQRDGVASRTRARIRLAPYTNEEAAGDRAGRDESPVRAYARAGVLDPESSNEVADQYADTVMEEAPVAEHAAEQPRGMNQQQEDAMTPSRRGEEQPGDVTVQPAPAHVPDEGDEEPRIYVFAGQGRRGVDSLVSPQPRLARL
ncbi:hypothetical protein PF001_g21522 [Phytophthora fragariae]|uniref:Integrase catalytic domain-containing protein n=3 Tax=Phytophthora fragariae TaxID=53985 RepID=A0A6A4CG91_9STRA|nr:hypothetical protein PF001_g21522 [Phytophthora fragariae]